MRAQLSSDATAFAARTLDWLAGDPIANNHVATVVLLALDGMVGGSEPLFALVDDGHGALAGCAARTAPHPLALSAMPHDAARALANAVADASYDLPGVSGPVEPTRAFADRWSTAAGRASEEVMAQRMFRLDAVDRPTGVPGSCRLATGADRDLALEWAAAFSVDVGVPQAVGQTVDSRLTHGRLWLWQHDGAPVSIAGTSPPVAGVVRISLVYTPPALRGRGYASGCVAEVSQRALDAGAHACMLFTDLSNPTSNAIYQRIGYSPVADAVMLRFT